MVRVRHSLFSRRRFFQASVIAVASRLTAQPQGTVLPVKFWRLPDFLPDDSVHDASGQGDHLAFLTFNGARKQQVLRVTDLDGRPKWQYAVPPDMRYGKIHVSASGSVMAYALIRTTRHLVEHEPAGGGMRVVADDRSPGPWFHFFVSDRLTMIRPDATLEYFDGATWRRQASVGRFDPVCTKAFGLEDRVLMVDHCEGGLSWQVYASGEVGRRVLASPAVAASRAEAASFQATRVRPPGDNTRPRTSVIGGMDVAGASLWCYLLPFDKKIGLVLEEFTLEGQLRRSLRLDVPKEGRLVPIKILALPRGCLSLVFPNGVVAMYRL